MLKRALSCVVIITVILVLNSVTVFAVPGGGEEKTIVNVTRAESEGEEAGSESNTGGDIYEVPYNTGDTAVDGKTADGETVVTVDDEDDKAKEDLDKIVYDQYIDETEQFLVVITNPETNETVFKKSYAICGDAKEDDVRVVLARRIDETEEYEYFENEEGDSSWDIGSFGVFTKGVELSYGSNNFKIVAYRKSDADNLVVNENVQVSYFTITVLKESIKDKIMRNMIELKNIFNWVK